MPIPTPLGFPSHERAAYGAVAFALGLASLAEIAFVHLLLSRVSEAAAWAATALGVYGFAWVVADYRAVVRDPHRVEPDTLRLRRGRLWRADIPMDRVVTARRPTLDERANPRAAVDLFLWLPAAPWAVVELREPWPIEGPSGIRKKAATLGVCVDDPDGFVAAVEARAGHLPSARG